MTATINNLVTSALDAAHAYGKGIDALRKAFTGQLSRDHVSEKIMPAVASYYRVPLVARERGEGVTWDKTHAKYETARKAHQRLVKDIMGASVNQKEEIEVPAHIAKLAAALVQAAGEYEGAAKLIATAIAQAKAK